MIDIPGTDFLTRQLIKVLLYKDTSQFKLVWKSLTVFCMFTLAPQMYDIF